MPARGPQSTLNSAKIEVVAIRAACKEPDAELNVLARDERESEGL